MSCSRRFVLAGLFVVAGFTGLLSGQGTSQQTTAPEDEFLKGVYRKGTPGLTLPVLVTEVKPRYPPEAMRAKVQGAVELQLVVATDGSVDRIRVLKSVDPQSLDAAAVAAAKQWKFKPGKLSEKAVPVAIVVVMEFCLG